ncbi:hypothetical protein C8034_v005181 [Colletotrichum sidae]|uniref:Nucleoside phosphorylase domain-containing protein n=1 Tax=Colletotrichum sidae TaxID=1347389 RepID=A0A4R8TV65_9PEZI|nr:hypothetical protein C8034_v005181 [Colletotrichum sidae]
MVGVGGGAPAPKHDVRLGDVVVGIGGGGMGGVIQYDYGKALQNGSFIATGHLRQPPQSLLTAVTVVRAIHDGELYHLKNAVGAVLQGKGSNRKFGCPPASSDRLIVSKHIHTDETKSCEEICGGDPSVLVIRNSQDDNDEDGEGAVLPVAHYGLIASGNQVMKDSAFRDKLAEIRGVLCFEMEAAGLMIHFPCLVVRGICDYSDSHKNKAWQPFAAMTAAAYAKDLLTEMVPTKIQQERRAVDVLETS